VLGTRDARTDAYAGGPPGRGTCCERPRVGDEQVLASSAERLLDPVVEVVVAAEDDRQLRQEAGEVGIVGSDDRRLRIGELELRRALDPDGRRGELAPARMALVFGAERDGREAAAVGAPCAEAAHASSFS
jgi:hypothetical protein